MWKSQAGPWITLSTAGSSNHAELGEVNPQHVYEDHKEKYNALKQVSINFYDHLQE
jgi:hypothetical protein